MQEMWKNEYSITIKKKKDDLSIKINISINLSVKLSVKEVKKCCMWTSGFTLMVLEAYSISSRVKWQQLLRFSLQNSWISWRLYRLSANDIVSLIQISGWGGNKPHNSQWRCELIWGAGDRTQVEANEVFEGGSRMCDVMNRILQVTGWGCVYVWITACLFSLKLPFTHSYSLCLFLSLISSSTLIRIKKFILLLSKDCIKLIRSDNQDVYNVRNDFLLK